VFDYLSMGDNLGDSDESRILFLDDVANERKICISSQSKWNQSNDWTN